MPVHNNGLTRTFVDYAGQKPNITTAEQHVVDNPGHIAHVEYNPQEGRLTMQCEDCYWLEEQEDDS